MRCRRRNSSITKHSRQLIEKLAAQTSIHQADKLNRQLYVDKQVKLVNDRVLYTVDLLYTAIHEKKQITFPYFEYTTTKKKVLKHSGQVYQFSPYSLIWNDDSYYVLGFSENHDKIVKFRVYRMTSLKLTELDTVPEPKDFCVEAYAKSVFQMYDQKTRTVTLRCENSLMKSIIGRFGTKVETEIEVFIYLYIIVIKCF